MEDDDGPMIHGESRERSVQEVPISDLVRLIGDGRLDRDGLDGRLEAAPSSDFVGGCPDEDPVQPTLEPVGLPELGQLPPAAHERLLDGILGEVRVAEDEAGGGIQARAGRADELGEGMPVAFPCSNHEPVLVHARLG
jgi:hypothetical protein